MNSVLRGGADDFIKYPSKEEAELVDYVVQTLYHLECGHRGSWKGGHRQRYCVECKEEKKVVRSHPKTTWCELCKESKPAAGERTHQ